jgi:DNA-binding transcriptional LysR family regulator
MRYRLEDIATFLAAIETGGLSAASRRLNVAKSVVSKRITDLEGALGATLLRRFSRGVAATDAGMAFYERARDLLAQLEDAATTAAGDRSGALSGPVRVAGPLSFGRLHLAPVLFAFLACHPGLELMLHLNDRVIDLAREGYDLAVRIGRLKDSSLIARKLAVSRRVLCCSQAYARRAGLPDSLEALKDHACIGYSNVPIGERWLFEAAIPGHKPRSIPVRPHLTVDNGDAICDAAIAGLGLTVLPTFLVADALRTGKLIAVLRNSPPVSDGIFVVYPPHRHHSAKIRALIEHLAAAFNDPPQWDA